MAKKVSLFTKEKLKNFKEETLADLAEIKRDERLYKSLVSTMRIFLEEERSYVLSLKSADKDLAVKHAYIRGRISGLESLKDLIDNAGDELERREK